MIEHEHDSTLKGDFVFDCRKSGTPSAPGGWCPGPPWCHSARLRRGCSVRRRGKCCGTRRWACGLQITKTRWSTSPWSGSTGRPRDHQVLILKYFSLKEPFARRVTSNGRRSCRSRDARRHSVLLSSWFYSPQSKGFVKSIKKFIYRNSLGKIFDVNLFKVGRQCLSHNYLDWISYSYR